IQEFTPTTYYGLQAITEKATFTWTDAKGQTRIFDETFMKEKFATVDRMKEGQISDVHSAQKMQPAPSLFDLTELQKEAHRRWSWSAKETLDRKSTRLNSSHVSISYAVFCLKK